MNKILLWGNGSSENHGCEALGITISEILNNHQIFLATLDSTKDTLLKKKENITLINYKLTKPNNLGNRIISKIERTLTKKNNYMNKIQNQNITKILKDVVLACSIGGDNYCYSRLDWLYETQNLLENNHVKSILLGCSIEPNKIDDKMTYYLKKFDVIIARESISYEKLKKINQNTYLVPDAAFALKPCEVILPDNFNKVIGINISPLILESNKNGHIIYENYKNLITYILEKTEYQIALIPHVVFNTTGGDIEVIHRLATEFNNTPRIITIEEHNCRELKYIISKCEILIAARTHASIAGYSSCTPTLVIGYSNKSIGIATDLFGDYKNYVIPSSDLKTDNELTNSFIWMLENKLKVQEHLQKIMPSYIERVNEIKTIIEKEIPNE